MKLIMKDKEMVIKYQANILKKMLALITINLFGILVVQYANILNLSIWIKLILYGLEIVILFNLVYILSCKSYLKVILKEESFILKHYRETVELKYNDIKIKYTGFINKKIVIYKDRKYRLYLVDYFNLKEIYDELERRILC